jgi:putative ABC transport system substrate-binding protein
VLEGTELVDNVRSPGGDITGVRVPGTEAVLKSFNSLLEFSPRFERILVIYDPNYVTTPSALEVLRAAALSANVTLQEVRVTQVQNTQAILQELEKSGDANMDAIQLLQDTLPRSAEASDAIFKFADAHGVPVAGGPKTLVQSGALLSASTDIVESAELAAPLADKILKGIPAGTIPVVSPQPHLYINYKKAQELGLTVPKGLLKQAVEIFR